MNDLFSGRLRFETERFTVVMLSPREARELLAVLLQDEVLAERVPWMTEKTRDGALREAFGIELQTTTGMAKVWAIVARELRMQIGAIVARSSLEGLDVEVLVASQFWKDEVVDEASAPVMEWLEENTEPLPGRSANLH